MFQVAIQNVLAKNLDAVSQSVVYPAGFDQNVTAGVQNVVDIIKYGLEDCPDQGYFLFGYSQGATVVQEALNELENASAAAVKSVVLVGNPYRIPGRLSNVDSQGRVDNRTAYGLFATQSLQSNGSIPTYSDIFDRSGKVQDICLEVSALQHVICAALTDYRLKNDIVCAADPDCDCQLASDHLSYGLMQSVQDLIVEHVVSQF
jgi:thioesterase domain-containing protein